ncbi:MAG TPA: cupin domain-containing protein [Solirubrobacteraceae bacterium]|jgi:mannose-6-phosphate isomerase-like protein (cupin superfamily)
MATRDELASEVTVDPVLRMRSRFWRTMEDGREVLHVETWVDPGGGVTPHVHPAMEERFEVLEGRPQFLSGRSWKDTRPGDTVLVTPGTRHAFRNRGEEVAHFVCRATPPSSLQGFLEDAAALSRAGGISRRALPRSLDGLLQAAVMAHHYRDMVTLLAPLPPPAVQRLVIPPLARAGERRGFRAGQIGR